MSGAWEWKPVKEDRSKKKFGVPFFFSSSMHYNRCAIEVHQWFMSVALMLVPFMTVSAYRVTDRGAASFLYTDTLLNILSFVWHPRRVKPVSISQTHLAALPNSRSASEVAMTSENEVTRSGNNQGDRGYWGMFDGGISFQSLCSRSLFEPDHHYRQPAHLKTGNFFFFLFHLNSVAFFSQYHLHVNTYPTAMLLYLEPFSRTLVNRIGVATVACI